MKQTITAIVPMRKGSERIPGKNVKLFGDYPLYSYILNSLLRCSEISSIIVDSDDQYLLDEIRAQYTNIVTILRPNHLGSSTTPMNEVLLNTIDQDDSEFYLQTHSTNPLLQSSTVSKSIKAFFSHYPKCDSLFGVTRLQTRLWNHQNMPINHDPNILQRTQDLNPVFEENSNVYIFSRDLLLHHGNRIGLRPYLFEIPKFEALDIDDIDDFILGEHLLKAFFQ